MDDWRILLYPLGFLPGLCFGGRAIMQWLCSESKGRSVVNRPFWLLSLTGNVALALHSLIQVQFHVCIVQACNAVIAWRNLNLMQKKKAPVSFRTVLALFAFVSVIVTVLFLIQGWFFNNGVVEMFRVPVTPWSGDASAELPLLWHAIGFTGIVLFASRFWVQWWFAEKHQKSFLGGPFWWISLIGDLLSLAYFTQIKDPVNFIGPALGLIPYIRNIILIRKEQRKERTT